ncbi:MAG TPA: sugar phosphate isomerase/epimerase [Candidatus Fournierella merdavium]|nr:sugar phosphate isomerase/epimerase [Candidatus Fournierella merdavium]
MISKPAYSVFLNMFTTRADRFCTTGYSSARSISQQFDLVRKLENISAVDVVAFSDEDLQVVSKELARGDIQLASVLPDITCDPIYQHGAFTAPDPRIRRKAIEKVCRCMDFAAAHGCNSVTIWPGQDGYDYLFQSNYLEVYSMLQAGLEECASYRGDVTLHIEYKPYEPRTHSYLDSCTSVLALLQSMGKENMGVVIDFGHTLMSNRSPAEAVALCHAHGVDRLHLHLNDSYAHMDDDLIPGTTHTLYYLEFFYWLRHLGYKGFITFDQFPYREDAVEAVTEARRWLDILWDRVTRMDEEEVQAILRRRDGIAASRLMRDVLFGA